MKALMFPDERSVAPKVATISLEHVPFSINPVTGGQVKQRGASLIRRMWMRVLLSLSRAPPC